MAKTTNARRVIRVSRNILGPSVPQPRTARVKRLGGTAQEGLVGDSSSGALLLSVSIDSGVSRASFGRRHWLASLPSLLWCRSSMSPGPTLS